MIEVREITKKFGDFCALSKLSCTIPKGKIYGLIGANGAGKSTFLRCVSGIYEPEEGEIFIDGEKVSDMREKGKFAFVPDELFFFPGATPMRMATLYASLFKKFSFEKFSSLLKLFKLEKTKNISKLSKGMKRQMAIILAISCCADYLFFDETFDGLDPTARNLFKDIMFDYVAENDAAIVISSHALRELEDTCDQLSLLYEGGIVFERDVLDLKTSLFKVQVAFAKEAGKEVFEGVDILNFQKRGKVLSAIANGEKEAVRAKMAKKNPVLLEILPLSLEEVFIFEMDALGYKFDFLKEGEVK